MARRRPQEEHQNQERWMVSYADFITLLFAFFVVMYSVSSVNEGKYRVLSESLVTAFKRGTTTIEPIQTGSENRAPGTQVFEIIKRPTSQDVQPPALPVPPDTPVKKQPPTESDPMHMLLHALNVTVAKLADEGTIRFNRNEDGIEVEISANILFLRGEAELSDRAREILRRFAAVLKPFPNEINVQGYTDNLPVRGGTYRSNWELSAARAASVVQLFIQEGVRAGRLSATGFGEFRPVADNGTEEGRNQNRRVVIFVPTERDPEKVLDALSQLGRDLQRGQPLVRPPEPMGEEAVRTEVPESLPPRATQSIRETQPALLAPRDAQTQPPLPPAIFTPRSPVNAPVVGIPQGERHISREPIEAGVANPPATTGGASAGP